MKPDLKKIIIISVIIISAIALNLAYYLVLPSIINIEKYKPEIRKYLKENVSVPLELGKLHINMIWNLGIRIKADKAVMKKNDGSDFVKVSDSYIELSLLPLINNHLVFRKIVVNNADADITRLKDGSFDIAKILNKKKKRRFKVEFKNTSLNLNNYRIKLNDKYMLPEKTWNLAGENISVKNFTPNKHIEIQAKGRASSFPIKDNSFTQMLLFHQGEPQESQKHNILFNLFLNMDLPLEKKDFTKNKLIARGNITNFDLDEIKPYINNYLPDKFSILKGEGNVSFDIDFNRDYLFRRKFFISSQTTGLNIQDARKGNVLSCEKELNVTASGNFDDNDLYLENFQVNGEKINTTIKGLISNFKKKRTRNVDLSLDVENTQAKTAAEIFPKTLKIPLDPFNKIIKHNIDGNVSGNLKIRGYYRRPELFGKIKYHDVSIIKKIPDTPNGYGTVDFLGATLVIDSTQYLDKNRFVKTTGTVVPFKGKKVDLKVNSTDDVDFAKALPALLAIRDMFEFKLTPVTEMDIKGRGKVNLDIKGAKNDVEISGYVNAKNATVKYETLAGEAENVNGTLKFTGEKVYYDELRGTVNGIEVIPSGYSTFKGYSDVKLHMPNLDLEKGLVFVNDSPLLEKAQKGLKEVIEAKGIADGTVFLKGTEEKLDSSGIFKFEKAHLSYDGFGDSFNNLKGQLRFKNDDVFLDKVSGDVNGNNANVDGYIGALNNEVDLKISSENINVEDARNFIIRSSLMAKLQEIVKDIVSAEGTASFTMHLKGNVDKNCLKNLVVNDINTTILQKNVGFPVKIAQGSLNVTDNFINIQNIKAKVQDADVTANGKISNLKANIERKAPLIPDINLKIKRFDTSTMQELAKSPLISSKIRNILSEVSRPDGMADISVQIKPSGFSANIDFDDYKMVYMPYDLPVEIKGGRMEITEKNINFSRLNGKISHSDFYINGSVKNYDSTPEFDIVSSLEIAPHEESKLKKLFRQPVNIENTTPINAKINGNINNWNVDAKLALNKGTSLGYSKQIGLPDDRIRTLTLDARGQKDKINIKSLKLDLYDTENILSYKSPWEFEIDGKKESLLHFTGTIDKLLTLRPEFQDFRMHTSNEKSLSVRVLNNGVSTVINSGNDNFFTEGDFQADITINGPVLNLHVSGFISFSGLKVPDYNFKLDNGNINFTEDQISIDFKGLKIEDSSMDITAKANYPLESPIMIRDVKISSDYFNIDKIAKILTANKDLIKTGNEDFKTPLFVVRDGIITAKELIFHDLITSDVKATLSYTPDWLLSLSDIQMKAAGGVGTANLYYNTKSTELSLNLNASNMQANAIATTLFRFPNEVYGTLSGEGQFYTKGRNSEEIISNSDGYASFKIYDGRLVRLGSLEYFLRAANVLQCGIGGFNFNNIIDLVAPQKTGNFEKLEGKFEIKDGVISTEEITSSGENLSLFISGDYDMLTNYADVKILGKLSKKVSGLLGPLGSVSINQFIGYVPGLGFLPSVSDERGIIELIPGLSKIPVLGLDFRKENNRQILVNINGNLYETSSVKSFRWLD